MPPPDMSKELREEVAVQQAIHGDDFEWLHHAFPIPEFLLEEARKVHSRDRSAVAKAKMKAVLYSALDINFRKLYEADPLEQVDIVKRGVNARMVDFLAAAMQMPKEKLIGTLGLARATIQRKSSQQAALSSDESSRVMGVSKLIGQAQAMVEASGAAEDFDAPTWVAQWLDQPLPALSGRKPGDLMDTAEGQAMVAQLLGRIQSSAYA